MHVFHHMQLHVYFEICLHNINCHKIISLARIVMVSMLDTDNECVLACHSICILFCMCQIDT